jgi:hypothetical protein
LLALLPHQHHRSVRTSLGRRALLFDVDNHADAVFKASPGTVVGPVPLKLGFAVAKVVEIVVGTDAELAAKRPQLEQHARKKYAAQARAHLVQQLRAKSGVKVDEAFLRGLKGLEASPAELDHVVATINGRPLRYRDVHRSIQSIVGGSGHLAGPAVRVQIAWSEVDARLVQDLAAERGYDRRPSVVAQAAAAERYELAIEVVERIRKAVPPPTQNPMRCRATGLDAMRKSVGSR